MGEPHTHPTGHHHAEDASETPDTTGGHGMLVIGEQVIYLSHLPMFMHPHNFQVLLEVEFDDAARTALLSDPALGTSIYTFDPVSFPIAELDPAGDGPARTSIEGTLVRGHFERGGRKIARGVSVDIRGTARFSVLDVDAKPTGDEELTYLCFGRAGRLYLAHEITARPSFDQVLQVRLVPGTVANQAGSPLADDVAAFEFGSAQPVRFGRGDDVGSRLASGEIATGLFFQTTSISGAHGFTVDVEVERELYLEIDELTRKEM